ncbi:MAG: hypothetical protein HY682_07050 [Chloroflexi bacterium]|nr:hypothetical protein [Chloroflexota bacterium]
MKTLTIRGIPDEVAAALEREKRQRGESLNQTVIDLLSQGLGVGMARSNGLVRLAGTWDDEEYRRFEEAIAPLEHVDEELWR